MFFPFFSYVYTRGVKFYRTAIVKNQQHKSTENRHFFEQILVSILNTLAEAAVTVTRCLYLNLTVFRLQGLAHLAIAAVLRLSLRN